MPSPRKCLREDQLRLVYCVFYNQIERPRTVAMPHTMTHIQVGYYEKFLLRKSGEALAQAAQGSGRLSAPRDVQETCRSGTKEYGLVGSIGGMVGLNDLRDLF